MSGPPEDTHGDPLVGFSVVPESESHIPRTALTTPVVGCEVVCRAKPVVTDSGFLERKENRALAILPSGGQPPFLLK